MVLFICNVIFLLNAKNLQIINYKGKFFGNDMCVQDVKQGYEKCCPFNEFLYIFQVMNKSFNSENVLISTPENALVKNNNDYCTTVQLVNKKANRAWSDRCFLYNQKI